MHQTLLTVAAIFLLFLVGYLAKKLGALKAGDASVINSLVVNLTMPAFIFVYTHKKPFFPAMAKAPVLVFLLEMLIVGAAYAAARLLRLDRRTTGAMMLVAAFGNTGFLGYPVTHAAFKGSGEAMLTAVVIDQFGMALPLCTIGVAIALAFSGSRFEWSSVLEFFRTPLFVATVIALVLRTAWVPKLIISTLTYLAAPTVPLVMLSTGLTLSSGPVRQYPVAILLASLLKMAALPALAFLLLPVIGAGGVVGKVTVLESAMPAAIFTGVVAGRYGANGPFAAGAIFLMTLASVVAIPGILVLMR